MSEPQKVSSVSIELVNGRSVWHYMTDDAIDELVSIIRQSDTLMISNRSNEGYTLV